MSDPIAGQRADLPRALSSGQQAWERLGTEQFDVVVIGGGVVGAGAALDAATRGLKVALVEARDFASGTSSRSSKMFHGGLRYLEQLEFGLVREALHERELSLTTLAPHLVKPLPFLFPLTNRWWERPYVAAGIFLYDQLGGAKSVPAQKHLTRAGALRLAPGLKRSSLIGGIRYYDTVVDDARHTMTVARTAAHYGAVVRTSTQVVSLLREGDRVIGVRVRDSEDGATTEVRGHVVVNATGVWTDEIQALSKQRGRFRVRASKGVHIVVPRDRIVSEVAIILRTEKSVLFVIPWGTHWIIGTTDTDWNLDLAHPAATKADIDYILGTRQQGAGHAADPRRHRRCLRGPAAAAGGGERGDLEAVARARRRGAGAGSGRHRGRQVHDLPGDGRGRDRRCRRIHPGPGGAVHHREGAADRCRRVLRAGQPDRASSGAHYGLHPVPGEASAGPLRFADRRGAGDGGGPPGAADADHGGAGLSAGGGRVRGGGRGRAASRGHPGPAHADLHRVPAPRRGLRREVAEVVAPVLGWSAEDIDREVDTYCARVEAEVRSQPQPDDESADALRAAAPEARAEILEPVPLN